MVELVSDSQQESQGDVSLSKKYWILTSLSAEEEEKMVAWFEAHPELWNVSSEAYKQTSTGQRDEMYNEYARESDIDGLQGLYI